MFTFANYFVKSMKTEHVVGVNSREAWVLASRPKTLTGAAVPVMMGGVLAWADAYPLGAVGNGFSWWVWLTCLLFAFIMQIDANFINDYFDFKKGTDDEHRLGPRRACAQGWVTISAMRKAIVVTTLLACLVGLPLLFVGGWEMLLVGAACVLFCFLYTTHLSYWGLGDVLVLVFFGLVPVCITYYLQLHTIERHVVLSALACGMVIDTLLVVNNYRDRDSDRIAGKKTIAVRIGERWTALLYFVLGLAACHMGLVFLKAGAYCTCLVPFNYLFLHAHTYRRMKSIRRGKALNMVLGETARNMFVFGLLFVVGVVADKLMGWWPVLCVID